MSRSGYSDDCENIGLWRGAVARAIRGKKGQAFFRALLEALDALPEKRLIAGDLQSSEGCCAMGAVAKYRGIDVSNVDPYDRETVASMFGIAPALAAEIAYENDEGTWRHETPEQRFTRIRNWAERCVKP